MTATINMQKRSVTAFVCMHEIVVVSKVKSGSLVLVVHCKAKALALGARP